MSCVYVPEFGLIGPDGAMISFLEGTLAEKSGDRVVIGVQGTGYEVIAPSATIAKRSG